MAGKSDGSRIRPSLEQGIYRSGEQAEWDLGELKLEFTDLLELNLGLDLELSGFTMGEIDTVLMHEEQHGADDDDAPEPPAQPVTCPGDVWQLGQHRLICGNALEAGSYQALMEDERALVVFCDPPYNVAMGMIFGKRGGARPDFAMAAGEMSRAEFTSFLTSAFQHLASYSVDGAIHYQCIDWRHIREMLDAGEATYGELKNLSHHLVTSDANPHSFM